MTEQMTGRQEAGASERPPAAATGPSGSPGIPGPSPRDLAARSPHREARVSDQPQDAPHQDAPPQDAPHQDAPHQDGPQQAHPQQAQPSQAQPSQAGTPAAPQAHLSPGKTQATGAQSLVYALERVGADVVFGIPGGAVLPAYDPLLDSKIIRHILVRHEQGAGHAATGYAQATGRVGVCMATSGPGATNLVTPIADAYMDSVPLVAITGQVPSAAIGTDAFQEADICGITMPITKPNFLVQNADDIPRTLAEAFHIAATGRPGPVLVDIAKDALQAQTTFEWPVELQLPGYRPAAKPHGKQVREAARLIMEAKRPVLYVGGGVIKAHATP